MNQATKSSTPPVLPLPKTSGLIAEQETRFVDPRLLRYLFNAWQPERPELLFRLRPRPQEVSYGSR